MLAKSYILSPQQLIDCDGANGCGGGNLENSIEYLYNIGGMETEADYPYMIGLDASSLKYSCAFSSSKVRVGVTDMIYIDEYVDNIRSPETALAG